MHQHLQSEGGYLFGKAGTVLVIVMVRYAVQQRNTRLVGNLECVGQQFLIQLSTFRVFYALAHVLQHVAVRSLYLFQTGTERPFGALP